MGRAFSRAEHPVEFGYSPYTCDPNVNPEPINPACGDSASSIPADSSQSWQKEQHILEILASLSYRAGELGDYLRQIACGVSELLGFDWTVITLCREGMERVMASSLDMGEGDHVYSLHGSLTNTVVETGRSLTVEDALAHPEYGEPPEGYISYLGVPLQTAYSETLGTICSFCRNPRQFTLGEIRTVELFAERAATAIDNYLLYKKQRQFNEILEAEVVKRTDELRIAQNKLIERERLAAIGEFAAMIVHEIRNPVTTVRMGLNAFKRLDLAERDRERLSLALEEADRLEHLLGEILLYAKPQMLHLAELEVNQLVQEMIVPLQEMPEAAERTIVFLPLDPPARIQGDRDKLKQVFINLVRNACEAIAPGETVTWDAVYRDDLTHVLIRVHNGGEPIHPEVLPKLTEPFYSTKASGTGLGLAIVRRIVEAHAGILSLQSDAETGTTITVQLPVA